MKIYSLEKIETPRLIIRPIALGDELALNQAIKRSLVSLQRWLPWAKNPSLEATLAFLRQGVASWCLQIGNDFPMAVIHKIDNKIIAGSGYNPHSVPIKPYYEIGYWIDEAYQGQGLMTECVNALTRYAISMLGAIRVQIGCQVENIKSINVAKRLGYTYELTRKQDRLDCCTHKPVDSVLFSCCDIKELPELKVTWVHKERTLDKEVKSIFNIFGKQHQTISQPLPILETQRLILKPPQLHDTEIVYQALICSLPEISPWFSWAKPSLTMEDLKIHLDEAIAAAQDIRNHDHLHFLVWNKNYNQFIGEVSFKIRDWSLPYFALSYWFDSRITGQGYAREALSEMIKFAFSTLQVKRLEVDISETNLRNLTLINRLGFIYEGNLRNHAKNFVTGEISASKLFALTDYSQFLSHQAILQ